VAGYVFAIVINHVHGLKIHYCDQHYTCYWNPFECLAPYQNAFLSG